MILGNPFITKIYSLKHFNEKMIIGTYEGKELKFEFITQHFTRIISEIQDLVIVKNNQINFLKEEI